MRVNHLRCCFSLSNKPAPLRLPSYSHFPLHSSIVSYLEAKEFHTPTFIQYGLLSKLFQEKSPRDNVAKTNYHIVSPTGSGKTLAYLIPILDQLKKEEELSQCVLTKPERPRALILTSNKELVLQARNVAKDISHYAKLRSDALGIGRSLVEEKRLLSQGVDVLVTPYLRFKRMLDKREVYLSMLRWIVVDEVDTLFEGQKGMLQDLLETIVLPKVMSNDSHGISTNTQLILSSTTNPQPLKEFLQKKLEGKVSISEGEAKKHLIKFEQIVDKNVHVNLQNIKHEFLHCQQLDKHDTLLEELKRDRNGKIMIFCNTVSSLHDLEYFLNREGFLVISLHSQLGKNIRLANYQQFRDCQKGILLATDLGARGLDFPRLKKVINYDFPLGTCDYLQRAGRTGRAGAAGTVVSLYFKKHLDVINQLKGASFSSPLKIQNSAYGFRNREETHRTNKFSKITK